MSGSCPAGSNSPGDRAISARSSASKRRSRKEKAACHCSNSAGRGREIAAARSLVQVPAEKLIGKLRESRKVPKSVVDSLSTFVAGEAVTPVLPLSSSLQGEGLLPARVEKLLVENGVLKATLRVVE